MTAAIHAFRPASPPALPLDESQLDAVLSRHTTAPRALDRLECQPILAKREGQAFRPLVAVLIAEQPVLMSADTARRLAVHQDSRGRTGAALDLMACADLSEASARALQKAMH
jgi:hypothetical protein